MSAPDKAATIQRAKDHAKRCHDDALMWETGQSDGMGSAECARVSADIITEMVAAFNAADQRAGWIRADLSKARNIMEVILPMARGYAAEHNVGRNAAMIADADRFMASISPLYQPQPPPPSGTPTFSESAGDGEMELQKTIELRSLCESYALLLESCKDPRRGSGVDRRSIPDNSLIACAGFLREIEAKIAFLSDELDKSDADGYRQSVALVRLRSTLRAIAEWDNGLTSDYSQSAKFAAMAREALARSVILEGIPSPHAKWRKALESIAANSCCDKCQEAARVAQEALRGRA